MPASMISAETGGSVNVTGSSIAMVATGPIPGNTPINVPSSTPKKHQMTLCQSSSATLKPRPRLAIRASMIVFLFAGPDRHRQSEALHEDGDRRDRQQHDRNRDDAGGLPRPLHLGCEEGKREGL